MLLFLHSTYDLVLFLKKLTDTALFDSHDSDIP